MTRFTRFSFVGLIVCCFSLACAEDWPESLGAGRKSEWNEKGILRQFPAEGLKVSWRAPVCPGYSGPAVADGRVFVTDYQKREGGGVERVLCLDEKTGQVRWTHENPAAIYNKFAYNSGPRATPTVDGDRVYVMGGAGDVYCLGTKTGELRWQVNLPEKFGAKIPVWGFAGAPQVYREVLIVQAGGADARVVGLNKLTGAELWRALPAPSDIGYSSPIVVKVGGADQLIAWVTGELASFHPRTGEVYWQLPMDTRIPCATPVVAGDRLFVSDFWKGSYMVKLATDRPAAELLWKRGGANEIATEALHALMCTPTMRDGYIYGVDSQGQFRCLNADTGERVWETQEVVREKTRWANAFIVRNRDAYFINNDRGELIIADLQPTGYHELGRTQLIKPTSGGAGTRQLGKVHWVMPAYANRHIVIRNDEEIIRVSLED